ncbi:MAG: hypothetical protein ACYS21_08075 [Planctomycetota bacterium]
MFVVDLLAQISGLFVVDLLVCFGDNSLGPCEGQLLIAGKALACHASSLRKDIRVKQMILRPMKLIAKLSIYLGFVLVIALALLIVLYYLGVRARFYQQRCILYSPEELLPQLQKLFDVNFPEDIENLKTAKSVPIEGVVYYILKFNSKPQTVERFLKASGEEIELGPYRPDWDRRGSLLPRPVPRWFREPIERGNMGVLSYSVKGSMILHIDTHDDSSYVVYIQGSFYTRRIGKAEPHSRSVHQQCILLLLEEYVHAYAMRNWKAVEL